MARSAYAYGVDIRRFRWLGHSMTAQTAMRALELRWGEHAKALMATGDLQYPEGSEALPILQEIVQVSELLHTALPGVRFVTARGRATGFWPLVTPLANARGGDAWLVLDREGLAALAPAERAFLLAQGLAHLQCGHGGLFMAHLVSAREGRAHLLVRGLLRSWSRIAAFSADRAGLLAAGELDPALRALARESASQPSWLPSLASPAERERALREFDRSRVVARVRSQQRYQREQASTEEIVAALDPGRIEGEPGAAGGPATEAKAAPAPGAAEVPADAWPLARCDQRLTQRLGLL